MAVVKACSIIKLKVASGLFPTEEVHVIIMPPLPPHRQKLYLQEKRRERERVGGRGSITTTIPTNQQWKFAPDSKHKILGSQPHEW